MNESGGKDGWDIVNISVHNTTFDWSNYMKHVANILHMMSRSVYKIKQLVPYYLVSFESDDGYNHNHNHNHNHIRIQLAIFGNPNPNSNPNPNPSLILSF